MEYSVETWTINKLISIYEGGNLDLNPPYQRNDIWSPPAKKRLIDSIKIGYPLPAFFIYERSKEKFEMVDGQQRTRTLLGYKKGLFPNSDKEYFKSIDQDYFLNRYMLAILLITKVNNNESVEDLYVRVNKLGTKVNRPEILRAQYYDTPFQNLVEKLADSESFQSLELFTESNTKRMNDLDFIAELLTLIRYGITDKKIHVDKFYEDDSFGKKEADDLENEFNKILNHFIRFNKIHPIKGTRYRQRNDFYTFWGFIKENLALKDETFDTFYKIMVLIEKDISPSNEKCFAFQEYAINCVSQSNSKRARELRLGFFNDLLLNKDQNPLAKKGEKDANETMIDVIEYYGLQDSPLEKVQEFFVINIDELQKTLKEPTFFT